MSDDDDDDDFGLVNFHTNLEVIIYCIFSPLYFLWEASSSRRKHATGVVMIY